MMRADIEIVEGDLVGGKNPQQGAGNAGVEQHFKRVDEVCGMLAQKGTELGGPWSDHLEGAVWELRIRLRDVAARVAYWCTPDGKIVFLTVFRKTRQHDQRQIDRAVRAQKLCESDHHGPAARIYDRQV
jgi:phage-related protein